MALIPGSQEEIHLQIAELEEYLAMQRAWNAEHKRPGESMAWDDGRPVVLTQYEALKALIDLQRMQETTRWR